MFFKLKFVPLILEEKLPDIFPTIDDSIEVLYEDWRGMKSDNDDKLSPRQDLTCLIRWKGIIKRTKVYSNIF